MVTGGVANAIENLHAISEFMTKVDDGGNVLIASHGVCEALSMLEAGAVGSARSELLRFLGALCGPESERSDRSGVSWHWSNVIVHQKAVRLKDTYLKRVKGGGTLVIDASDAGWTEQLKDVIGRYGADDVMDWLGGLDTPLRLISFNAFSGEWQVAFRAEGVERGKFFNWGNAVVQVPMIEAVGSFPYVESEDGIRCVAMSYRDPRFSAIIALSTNEQHRDVVELFGHPDVYGALRAPVRQLKVVMPRFSVRRGVSLKRALTRLGVASVFRSAASGLDEMVDGVSSPYVDDVLHHAVLEVDERGTRTRSVTAVNVFGASRPTPFVVDRPFIFLVVDRKIDRALFVAAIRELKQQ